MIIGLTAYMSIITPFNPVEIAFIVLGSEILIFNVHSHWKY